MSLIEALRQQPKSAVRTAGWQLASLHGVQFAAVATAVCNYPHRGLNALLQTLPVSMRNGTLSPVRLLFGRLSAACTRTFSLGGP